MLWDAGKKTPHSCSNKYPFVPLPNPEVNKPRAGAAAQWSQQEHWLLLDFCFATLRGSQKGSELSQKPFSANSCLCLIGQNCASRPSLCEKEAGRQHLAFPASVLNDSKREGGWDQLSGWPTNLPQENKTVPSLKSFLLWSFPDLEWHHPHPFPNVFVSIIWLRHYKLRWTSETRNFPDDNLHWVWADSGVSANMALTSADQMWIKCSFLSKN